MFEKTKAHIYDMSEYLDHHGGDYKVQDVIEMYRALMSFHNILDDITWEIDPSEEDISDDITTLLSIYTLTLIMFLNILESTSEQ